MVRAPPPIQSGHPTHRGEKSTVAARQAPPIAALVAGLSLGLVSRRAAHRLRAHRCVF